MLAVHTPEYLERLRAACAGGPGTARTRPSPPARGRRGRSRWAPCSGPSTPCSTAACRGRSCTPARPATMRSRTARSPRRTSTTWRAGPSTRSPAARPAWRSWTGTCTSATAPSASSGTARGPRRVAAPARLVSRPRGRVDATGARAPRRDVNVPLPAATTDGGYLLAFDEIGRRSCAASGPTSSCSPRARTPPCRTRRAGCSSPRAASGRSQSARRRSPRRCAAGGSSPARRAATARSTTRSACSPCWRGWRARTPASPIRGRTIRP